MSNGSLLMVHRTEVRTNDDDDYNKNSNDDDDSDDNIVVIRMRIVMTKIRCMGK